MRSQELSLALLAGIAATGLAGAAQAEDVKPVDARSIVLGPYHGTAYYTVEKNGYQLVATVAAQPDAMPVRIVATLAADQSVTLSVPGPVGGRPSTLTFARRGERVQAMADAAY